VLELVYYRYLYFQEDGRVLYALTATPPHEMFPRFRRVCLQPQQPHNTTIYIDRSAVWGTYTVQRTHVVVTAQQEWQYVKLELSIDLDNHRHGRYGCLTFDKHWTSVDGTFSDQDRRGYDVPAEPFRFVKEKRL
jgi:F-box protein 9